jgi:hypothetical protein
MGDARGLQDGAREDEETAPVGAAACAFAVLPVDRDQAREAEPHHSIGEIVREGGEEAVSASAPRPALASRPARTRRRSIGGSSARPRPAPPRTSSRTPRSAGERRQRRRGALSRRRLATAAVGWQPQSSAGHRCRAIRTRSLRLAAAVERSATAAFGWQPPSSDPQPQPSAGHRRRAIRNRSLRLATVVERSATAAFSPRPSSSDLQPPSSAGARTDCADILRAADGHEAFARNPGR